MKVSLEEFLTCCVYYFRICLFLAERSCPLRAVFGYRNIITVDTGVNTVFVSAHCDKGNLV